MCYNEVCLVIKEILKETNGNPVGGTDICLKELQITESSKNLLLIESSIIKSLKKIKLLNFHWLVNHDLHSKI